MEDLVKGHDGYDTGRHDDRQRIYEPNACMLHADAGEGGRGEQPALLAPLAGLFSWLLLAPGSILLQASGFSFSFWFL
jgi:hypothetical protein